MAEGNGFQSSPAPKDGRYAAMADLLGKSGLFQSSPAPKDGRYQNIPLC